MDHTGPGGSPMLAQLRGRPRTTPLTATVAVYVADAAPGTPFVPGTVGAAGRRDAGITPGAAAARPAVTLTLATYADAAGALATYNNWFAEFGFMAAAERTPLGLGDQSARFDVGWPPFHAAIARSGPRFVLVEAGAQVPAGQRSAVLDGLAASALAPAAEQGGGAR